MKYVVRENYTEERHITVDLPEDATEEQIRDAAFSAPADEWESDRYDTNEFQIQDEHGNDVDFAERDDKDGTDSGELKA